MAVIMHSFNLSLIFRHTVSYHKESGPSIIFLQAVHDPVSHRGIWPVVKGEGNHRFRRIDIPSSAPDKTCRFRFFLNFFRQSGCRPGFLSRLGFQGRLSLRDRLSFRGLPGFRVLLYFRGLPGFALCNRQYGSFPGLRRFLYLPGRRHALLLGLSFFAHLSLLDSPVI